MRNNLSEWLSATAQSYVQSPHLKLKIQLKQHINLGTIMCQYVLLQPKHFRNKVFGSQNECGDVAIFLNGLHYFNDLSWELSLDEVLYELLLFCNKILHK